MGNGCNRNFRQLLIFLVVALFCIPILTAQKGVKNKPVTAKIVSWNIQMLPNALGMFSKALRKKQRIRAPWVIEHCKVQDYDVIVFQEVFDLDIKRKLKKELKETYPYQVNTKTKAGKMTSNGIFIVSRVPMKYIDHVIYQKGVKADGMAAKGCTLVEIEKEGVKFHIAGTHLQSGGEDKAIMHRDLQYKDIRNLLDANKVDTIPVFVMGDMNTNKANEKYTEMLEVIDVLDFPLDEEEPYTIDGNNSWNKGSKAAQIDYVMLQPRQTATKITLQKVLRPKHEYKGGEMDLADHYGVVADVLVSN